MNESEKRRRELLRSAREMYGDSHMPPAVHPRFRNIYGDLYESEEQSSGLQTRLLIGCVLFLVFVQMVEQDANAVESWSDLIIK